MIMGDTWQNKFPDVRKELSNSEQMSPSREQHQSLTNFSTAKEGDIQQVCPLGMGRAENLPV